jgi:hypothetical protein
MRALVAFVLATSLAGLGVVPSYGSPALQLTALSELLDYLWVPDRRALVIMILLTIGIGVLAYRAQLALDRHRNEEDWGMHPILRRKTKRDP